MSRSVRITFALIVDFIKNCRVDEAVAALNSAERAILAKGLITAIRRDPGGRGSCGDICQMKVLKSMVIL